VSVVFPVPPFWLRIATVRMTPHCWRAALPAVWQRSNPTCLIAKTSYQERKPGAIGLFCPQGVAGNAAALIAELPAMVRGWQSALPFCRQLRQDRHGRFPSLRRHRRVYQAAYARQRHCLSGVEESAADRGESIAVLSARCCQQYGKPWLPNCRPWWVPGIRIAVLLAIEVELTWTCPVHANTRARVQQAMASNPVLFHGVAGNAAILIAELPPLAPVGH
jgi:hypothetical protein